jgi:hypothetical protein
MKWDNRPKITVKHTQSANSKETPELSNPEKYFNEVFLVFFGFW